MSWEGKQSDVQTIEPLFLQMLVVIKDMHDMQQWWWENRLKP